MKKKSPPITPEMAAFVKNLIEKNELNQHDIAAIFGINQGLVSEIKHGKYDHLLN